MSLIYVLTTTFWSLVALAGLALAGDIVHLDSLFSQCQFMVDGNKFDLCPLFDLQKHDGWLLETEKSAPPSIMTNQYRLKIDGSLAKNETLEDNMQCPPGTTICLTTYTRYQGYSFKAAKVLQTVPVAGAMAEDARGPFVQSGDYTPGLNVEAKMARLPNRDSDSLAVTLKGGYYVDQPQEATIHFICENDMQQASFRHAFTWGGKHNFVWKSPQACYTATENNPPPPPSTDKPNPDDQEDKLAPPIRNRSNRMIWTPLLSLALVMSVVGFIIYNPPRAMRRAVSAYLKGHPSWLGFRVSEGVLVRWAHEEIDLDDGDEVVDGDDVSTFVDEDEYIPLKPSPRKIGHISYGSTY